MLRTLYAKLAVVMVILLTVVGVAYGTFTLYNSKLFLQELNQRFNRDLARQLLVDQNILEDRIIDEKVVKAIFKRYMHINPAIEIYLLNANGDIIAFDAPKKRIKRTHVDLEPLKRFLNGELSYPIVGDDPRHETRQKVFSVAAHPWKGTPQQYLYVVLSSENFDSTQTLLQDSYFLQMTIIAIVSTFIFGVLAALFIFNLLTRRLTRLSLVMESFRQSDFHQRFPYSDKLNNKDGDEIDLLGVTYDQMSQRIIELMDTLENKDNLRRNLIANVSHDLRTPLATLRGYLETLMLKTGTLPVDLQREYLGIAYRHSERLTTLISDLFELSRLDAEETPAHMESLTIAELIADIVQQFNLRAQEKKILIEFKPVTGLPLVNADIAMLERVLENLISNAIDHTPEAGEIIITAQNTSEGVEIAVSNSGAVIKEDDIPHLFERFYQSPDRRGGVGAGLGLAIVKRIIELHGSSIEVISQPDQLTTFRFTLAVKQ